MDWLDATVPFVRGIHVAAVLSAFGALVFRLLIVPTSLAQAGREEAALVRERLTRLFWASMAMAVACGFGWLILEAAAISGARTMPDVASSLGAVAFHTRFGKLIMLRLGAVALCSLLFGCGTHRGRVAVAMVVVGVSIAIQAGMGHAGAIRGPEGARLVTSGSLHLLAAGAGWADLRLS